jgi:hypothetical protein
MSYFPSYFYSVICWRVLAATGVSILMGLPAVALTWGKTSLDFTMEAGGGELVAEFPFKNEGAGTVTIGELKSSCGCSTPTVKSRTVAPRESGVVKVVYAAGDRVGPQSARLTVTTDEAGVAPVVLLLKIDIQPALTFAPRLSHWSRADGAVPRTVAIKQTSKSAVRILAVKPANDALAAELKQGAVIGEWELVLTPKSVAQATTTKVEIHAEVGGRKAIYSVFGVVR